jgi:anti-sigma factor RsiW
MPPTEHLADLLPAYALGVLGEDETTRVATHLTDCPACQAELRAYRAVADRLPFAAPEVQPPARVRRALMERVAPRPVAPGWRASPGSRAPRLISAWGVVSLVLLVVLGSGVVLLWQQLSRPPAGPMREVQLAGMAAAPEATGLLVISANGRYGTLIVDHLPPPNARSQYQLWLNRDGQHVNGGVFSVNDDGYASIPVLAPEPLVNFSSFGVTIEPAGGSPSPTGERVLSGAR